jgi:hypothetical protein
MVDKTGSSLARGLDEAATSTQQARRAATNLRENRLDAEKHID